MNVPPLQSRPLLAWLTGLAAALIALASALPYAGGWNDGSRLAFVEALVDYHTLAIDDSIFVHVPTPAADQPTPYPAEEEILMTHGTLDKLGIGGHFYSDKPPLLEVFLAGLYQIWRWCGGPSARLRPDCFCYLMTLASAGLAYVAAVVAAERLAWVVGLPARIRLALAGSLALGSFALAYTRHVNSHLVLLGVTMPLLVHLALLARQAPAWSPRRLAWIGTLAGMAYTIDLGVGPVLLACLVPLLCYRSRCWQPLAVFGLAALPWLLAHHALNYAIGGTFGPANAVPAYFTWPGCPFNPANMTGTWNQSPGSFAIYAASLLGGKRGFLGHNLPMFLALAGLAVLARQRPREWPELVCGTAWCVGVWLMFAALSNNSSGLCCGVRWLVPLLGPGIYVLAVLLRDHPTYRADFLVLSSWGLVLGACMWWDGPWRPVRALLLWPIEGAALLSWCLCRWRQSRMDQAARVGTAGSLHRAWFLRLAAPRRGSDVQTPANV